ncbi:Uncharacterised protein [Burkholderia gladioli]|nr:Uncharacterised protein [Burkholderia gladioli]
MNIHFQPAMPSLPSICSSQVDSGPPTSEDSGVDTVNQASTRVR